MSEVLSDYIEIVSTNLKNDEEMEIEINIKPKGREFFDKKKKLDPSFDEDNYIQLLIIKGLSQYIDAKEKELAGEIDEIN